MATIKHHNVKTPPTAQSPEGLYYVLREDNEERIDTYIVSNGKVKKQENSEEKIAQLAGDKLDKDTFHDVFDQPNLADLKNIVTGKWISTAINVGVVSNVSGFKLLLLPVEANKTITISGWNTRTGTQTTIAFFSVVHSIDSEFSTGLISSGYNNQLGYGNKVGGTLTLTPPSGCKTMLLTIRDKDEDDTVFEKLMISYGTEVLPYADFGTYYLKKEALQPDIFPKEKDIAPISYVEAGSDLHIASKITRGGYIDSNGGIVISSSYFYARLKVFPGIELDFHGTSNVSPIRILYYDHNGTIIKKVPVQNLLPRTTKVPMGATEMTYSGTISDLESGNCKLIVKKSLHAYEGIKFFNIKNNLNSEIHALPKNVENVNGVLKIAIPSCVAEEAHLAFDFRFKNDINVGDDEKRIKIFNFENVNKNDGVRAAAYGYYRSKKTTQLRLNPLKLHGLSIGEDCLYPIPYHNTGFGYGTYTKPGATLYNNEVNFAKRNLREYRPLSGEDVFSLRYVGSIMHDDTLSVDDAAMQQEYEENQNWYINVLHDRLEVSNIDYPSNSVVLNFSTYPTIQMLLDKLYMETNGGRLSQFELEIFEVGRTGYTGTEAISRPSSDLLQCSLKLINRYPKDEQATMRWDAHAAYLPFAKDESWHTCEIVIKGNYIYVRYDGQYEYQADYLWGPQDVGIARQYCHNILSENDGYLYIGGGIEEGEIVEADVELKDLVVNFGNLGDAEITSNYRIISERSPLIIGWMLHEIVEGKPIGRLTKWDDIPAKNRVSFNYIKNRGGATIVDATIDQSTVINNADGTVSATTNNGLSIRGVRNEKGIHITEEPPGWSTRIPYSTAPLHPLFYGDEITEENVAFTTGDLDRLIGELKSRNFVHVTYKDILNWKKGNFNMPKRAFHLLSDDYHDYQYENREIRKIFDKHNIKFATCFSLYNMPFREGQQYRNEEIRLSSACTRMRLHGWEPIMHGVNHNGFSLSDSKTSRRSIADTLLYSEKLNIISTMWAQGNGRITPTSQKLMEHSGVNVVIAATGTWLVRANPCTFIPRTAFYFSEIDKYMCL